jgi:hypothetical protein
MREAMIICPRNDNEGASLLGVQRAAVTRLIKAFGGCTIREAFGCWEHDGKVIAEPVWELVAACEDTPANAALLTDVAKFVGASGGQFCVYARFANGNVEIIDTAKPLAAAA